MFYYKDDKDYLVKSDVEINSSKLTPITKEEYDLELAARAEAQSKEV